MFCPNCGGALNDDAKFCLHCGSEVAPAQPQQPPYQEPVYQQPIYQQPFAPVQSMKWYKFLIYFALFAGAVLNFINAIQYLTGSLYEDSADLVYSVFGSLKGLDILMGLASLGLAGLGIYARFRLSGYHKNGPTMLSALYIAVAAVQVVYTIGVVAILPEYVIEYIDFSSIVVSIAVSVAMVFANKTYFAKRQHLFIND